MGATGRRVEVRHQQTVAKGPGGELLHPPGTSECTGCRQAGSSKMAGAYRPGRRLTSLPASFPLGQEGSTASEWVIHTTSTPRASTTKGRMPARFLTSVPSGLRSASSMEEGKTPLSCMK